MNARVLLVMATAIEAAPFIESLTPGLIEEKPFRLYGGNDHVLILSGIGKARAAMATSLALYRFAPRTAVNLGAAGALGGGFSVGDILQVGRIMEPDRPALVSGRDRVLVPDLLPGFKCATLATQDHAVVLPGERQAFGRMADLADMEGAAFLQACRLMNSAGSFLFKIVTDTPEHDNDRDIIENVRATAPLLFKFYNDKIRDQACTL